MKMRAWLRVSIEHRVRRAIVTGSVNYKASTCATATKVITITSIPFGLYSQHSFIFYGRENLKYKRLIYHLEAHLLRQRIKVYRAFVAASTCGLLLLLLLHLLSLALFTTAEARNIYFHALLTKTILQIEVSAPFVLAFIKSRSRETGDDGVKFYKLLKATHLHHLHSFSLVAVFLFVPWYQITNWCFSSKITCDFQLFLISSRAAGDALFEEGNNIGRWWRGVGSGVRASKAENNCREKWGVNICFFSTALRKLS